jgi:hypothetical protein
MQELLRKGRAWAAVFKSAALFMLPGPLFFAALIDLASGHVEQFMFSGGALACLWTAGAVSFAGLVEEARFFVGQRLDPPRVPLKLLSLALTALGTGLAATSGGHGPLSALLLAALAAGGHRAFFGRDPRPHRIELPPVAGVDVAAVMAQLKQAYGRLQGIDTAAGAIAVPEFGQRLRRITAIGYRILEEIERDPRDASRARKFLNVYLDSAERVTVEYARSHRQLRNRPLEDNFRQLLIDMETTFEAQHRRLLENDALALDVEIEVLNERLKREGLN